MAGEVFVTDYYIYLVYYLICPFSLSLQISLIIVGGISNFFAFISIDQKEEDLEQGLNLSANHVKTCLVVVGVQRRLKTTFNRNAKQLVCNFA